CVIFASAPSCTVHTGLVDSLLRRARSASRSKPNRKAVRRGRKARAESRSERWTKAQPTRRILFKCGQAGQESGRAMFGHSTLQEWPPNYPLNDFPQIARFSFSVS